MASRAISILCFVALLGCSSTAQKATETPSVDYFENPPTTAQFTFKKDALLKVGPDPAKGFNYAYYLLLPSGVESEKHPVLLIEPNNTGRASDDMSLHDQAAKKVTERGYYYRISKRLKLPMLVPVFPRPKSEWQNYIHYLNRRTIQIKEGPLKRVDLQLIAMVEDARARMAATGINIAPKFFMNGFSSSASFSLRFTALHPRLVQAVSAGGINALPILPVKKWQNQKLPYPIR
ncbi:MAG: hypothetical protein AB7K68_09135 [Bacteriovoracia bacterium]